MFRAIPLLISVVACSAFAQQNNWNIDRVDGTAVMDEISPLIFRVTNVAGSRDNLQSFTIAIPNGQYDLDGATAPSGWRASNVDKKDRTVTFLAINACSGPTVGLRPGQSALFEIRVVGSPGPSDSSQDVTRGQTVTIDPCNTGVSFKGFGGTHSWMLVGLSAKVATSVRALDVNDQLTVTLTIANASTGTQSGITPTAPVITGTATFALVSGPLPGLVNSLAVDGAATFAWVYKATGGGSARFSTSARNTSVSSPVVISSDVNVGIFPATVIATPATTVPGGVITLQVLPTNNAPSPLTHVMPLTPTVTATGTASATIAGGPTPTSVDALGSRSTTAFTTTWTIQGNPGDRVTFQARATGTDSSGATVTSSPVSSGEVTLRELTITPSPYAVITGSGVTQISYRVANGSPLPITAVVLMTPDATLFRTPTAVSVPSGWTTSLSTTPRGIRFDATTAARIQPGQSQTFTISYASIGPVTANTPTSHRAHVIYTDLTTQRADSPVTVVVNRAVPDIMMPVAVATPNRVHFTWSNPTIHDGVLILRSAGAPPNPSVSPVAGRRYGPGTTLGNATVVYEDTMSFNSSFADTGLTNGVTYYYRLYNRDEWGLYSPGNVPTTSPNNYLLVITPGTTSGDALWCSTMGLPALQQPYVDLGRAIYQSTNGSFFTGNVITLGAPINGNEKWRPTLTRGVVQARPTFSGSSIYVGDQLGYAYSMSAGTGAINWTGNGSVALGEVIQAQSVMIGSVATSAAFKTAYGSTDLVLFATRNNTSPSTNSVTALNRDTGLPAFSYQPGNLGQVTGPVVFDYVNSLLWIGSASAGGPSLRVINALTPTAAPVLTVTTLGDLPSGVTRQGFVNQMLVVDRSGVARGYSISAAPVQLWQTNVGGTVTNPLVTFQNDFFASTATGVQRFHIDTATNTVTPVWAAPAAMRLPSSVRVDGAAGKVFVSDADGYLHRLTLATGALERAVKVSTAGGLSMPALDTTANLNRVYVGTGDGRLCAFPTTF